MKTYEYAGAAFEEPRSHPWLGTATDPELQYYDLTATPALIRSSLEDFLPWSHFAGVQSFYEMLERLNHPKSALESNDCAFSGPHANENTAIPKALQCCGRVMVLFRALHRNLDNACVSWLQNALLEQLAELDPAFQWGAVGTTQIAVRYRALRAEAQLGSQLMISFWAWGDSEADTMQNLARVIKNLTQALRRVSAGAKLASSAHTDPQFSPPEAPSSPASLAPPASPASLGPPARAPETQGPYIAGSSTGSISQ